MKNLSLFLLLFLLWPYQVNGSLPVKGSPHRCQDKEDGGIILPVDDLLPAHYTDAASKRKAIEKMRKITPNQMIQSVVDHLLSFHDLCGEEVAGVGGWTDGIGTALCERLGAFDMTHDTILSGISPPPTDNTLSVSPSDLMFLQMVYKACRMSIDRYWNYPSVVHVNYQPTPQERIDIHKAMGHSDWTF